MAHIDLDISDMKYLLNRINSPIGSKSNKTALSEKLVVAMANGRFSDIITDSFLGAEREDWQETAGVAVAARTGPSPARGRP